MKHLSMRTKLCIIIVVVLVPFVILQSAGIVTHHKGMMDSEFRASQDYAEAVSTAFTNYLENLWGTELAIGLFISNCPENNADIIEKYMGGIMENQPTVLRYSWIDMDGKVIASTLNGSRGKDLSDREHFLRIISGEEKVVSNIIEGRLSQETILPVACGIRKDGKLIGIISAAVDVNRIGMVLPDYMGNRNSLFGIVDRNGRIVYLNGRPDMLFDKRTVRSGSPAWAALDGKVVRTESRISEIDGKERMGIDIPIKDIGWECFVTTPVAEVLANNTRAIRQSIFVMIFVTLASFLTAFAASERVLKPIEVLRNASESISDGDLSARTNIEGTDELAAAGKAFDQMAERIQSLEASRRLFLQTSAHELRNPMMGIKGIVSLVRRRISSGKPLGNTMEMMNTLENEVDRLSRVLNEILEAYRVQKEENGLRANKQRINISDVVALAMGPYGVTDDAHTFTFNSEVQGPVWVYGDPERLEDALRNLLGNAIKYSPANTEIKVSLEIDANYVTISIKDQGIGIPEGQLTKIFESFYRSDNLKGNDPGGMGLGLYICSDIIKRHNGSIWAENNKDKGSTFYVRLPILKETGEV